MREVTADLWSFLGQPLGVIVIPTNGDLKSDESLVMGKGVAKVANGRFRGLSDRFGSRVKAYGNHVHLAYWTGESGIQMFGTFPTKHHWSDTLADPALIRRSAGELADLAEGTPKWTYYLPRPGCGAGGLEWKTVRPLLVELPANVVVVSQEGKKC